MRFIFTLNVLCLFHAAEKFNACLSGPPSWTTLVHFKPSSGWRWDLFSPLACMTYSPRGSDKTRPAVLTSRERKAHRTRWHIGEQHAQSKTFSPAAEARGGTEAYCPGRRSQTEQTRVTARSSQQQQRVTKNVKNKMLEDAQKSVPPFFLRHTYDITACQLQECLNQGSKQRQWAYCALQKAI